MGVISNHNHIYQFNLFIRKKQHIDLLAKHHLFWCLPAAWVITRTLSFWRWLLSFIIVLFSIILPSRGLLPFDGWCLRRFSRVIFFYFIRILYFLPSQLSPFLAILKSLLVLLLFLPNFSIFSMVMIAFWRFARDIWPMVVRIYDNLIESQNYF